MESQNLSNYRKSYQKQELLETNCPENPIKLFKDWFSVADQSELIEEANAMTVATVGADGFPKSRVVLLKKYDNQGFVFYTNYTSEKGQHIDYNNKLCLSFFWAGLEQQIIIKGTAQKLPEMLSDEYFKSRPRGSQLGALVSHQSTIVNSRQELHDNLQKIKTKFDDKEIERPLYWGGYLVKPLYFEFWQGRPNRLHDRIQYSLNEDFSWKIERLAP